MAADSRGFNTFPTKQEELVCVCVSSGRIIGVKKGEIKAPCFPESAMTEAGKNYLIYYYFFFGQPLSFWRGVGGGDQNKLLCLKEQSGFWFFVLVFSFQCLTEGPCLELKW